MVLTGAGISAESGLSTFRDSGGLWDGHDPMVVATPEAYADDPALVQRFYDERRAALSRVQPNAAHHALVRLEQALAECDLFVSIGTSGLVYPAAAFVHWAAGDTLELNLEPSAGATDFRRSRRGPASELVPAWVDELLG